MKRILTLLFISVLFINSVFSQKYKKQPFTLFKYNCLVDASIIKNLAEYENYIVCKAPKDYTKVEMMFVQAIFTTIKSKMQDKYGLDILPIEVLGDKISYNDFGFPDVMINTAIKKGNTKYYFKLNVSIQKSSKLPDSNTEDFWPIVKIEIDLFNKDGYQPIKSTEGISEAVGIMKKSCTLLDGLDCVTLPSGMKPDVGTETLQTLINDAVELAIKKL